MSAKGLFAAAIVGLGAWALQRYAEDRQRQPVQVAPVSTGTGNNGDFARRVTDGFFSIFEAIRAGDDGRVQSTGQGVLNDIFGTLDVPVFDTGTVFNPSAIPQTSIRPRARVAVPATTHSPGPTTGLTRDHGSETISGVTVVYQMGSKRPYRPNRSIVSLTARAVASVFGRGSKLVITSGQEGDQPQHGSNRHKTGFALDGYILRPNGSRVLVADFDQLARALARMGAKGIGWGPEYLGNTIHVDQVMPGPGQAHTWGSRGKAMRAEITRLMGH